MSWTTGNSYAAGTLHTVIRSLDELWTVSLGGSDRLPIPIVFASATDKKQGETRQDELNCIGELRHT